MAKAAKDPWFKFFPSDWRADPALRSCSLGARGLWVECMCIMHEATPYGHLKVNGRPVTDAALASLAGCQPDLLPDLIGELEIAGVFSRTGDGTIYSRRMTRDDKRRKTARKNGQKGGNEALKRPHVSDGQTREKTASDNPQVNPWVKGEDNTHMPYAIFHKPDDVSSFQSETSPPTGPPKHVFVGRVIRLAGPDYARWAKAYHGIADIEAALMAADDWITGESEATQKRWFHVVSAMLRKQHEAALVRAAPAKPIRGSVGSV